MQLLPFTCGPAALIRLLRDRGFDTPDSLQEQIAIWRTANIVAVSDEPAACSGEGLVIAADDRGLRLRLYSARPLDFTDTLRDPDKRELIQTVVADQRAELVRRGLAPERFDLAEPAFAARLDAAEDFIVLVRQTYLSRHLDYHWIFARRIGADVRVYDPYLPHYDNVKRDLARSGDCFTVPFAQLLAMSRLNGGRDRLWLF
ncbi:MAG: peptidase C39 family protein [Bauldia sp.]|nr:peptidase C39 family protein [Bauldia sp.]